MEKKNVIGLLYPLDRSELPKTATRRAATTRRLACAGGPLHGWSARAFPLCPGRPATPATSYCLLPPSPGEPRLPSPGATRTEARRSRATPPEASGGRQAAGGQWTSGDLWVFCRVEGPRPCGSGTRGRFQEERCGSGAAPFIKSEASFPTRPKCWVSPPAFLVIFFFSAWTSQAGFYCL